MKKLLIALLVHAAATLTATSTTAQQTALVRTTGEPVTMSAATFTNGSTNGSSIPLVNNRLQENFDREFGITGDVHWTATNNGFLASFLSAGIQHRAFFTRQGQYQWHVLTYTEGGLPAAVRHQVKSRYYDFAITGVQEVRYNDAVAYLVSIADQTEWKIIRVVDGAMDLWKSYRKG